MVRIHTKNSRFSFINTSRQLVSGTLEPVVGGRFSRGRGWPWQGLWLMAQHHECVSNKSIAFKRQTTQRFEHQRWLMFDDFFVLKRHSL